MAEVKPIESFNEEGNTHIEYEETFRFLKKGDIIKVIVVQINGDGVLVSYGGKSEGIIPLTELSLNEFSTPNEVVFEDQEIEAQFIKYDDETSTPIFSKKRADLERIWRMIITSFENKSTIVAKVIDVVKGGLLVDIGIKGFVPISQIELERPKRVKKYLGKSLRLRVLDYDRKKNNVILSQRVVLEEEKLARKQALFNSFKVGDVIEGQITTLKNFGAFVDLKGVEGLIPISEISWDRVVHPASVLKTGQKVEAKIIEVNKDEERITLSLKELQDDPWLSVHKKFSVGSTVEGRITKITQSVLFVRIGEGIEGIVPPKEFPLKKDMPEGGLKEGLNIKVKILDIKSEQRRIILSIKEVIAEEEGKKIREFLASQRTTTVTMGDLLREKFGDKIKTILSSAQKKSF